MGTHTPKGFILSFEEHSCLNILRSSRACDMLVSFLRVPLVCYRAQHRVKKYLKTFRRFEPSYVRAGLACFVTELRKVLESKVAKLISIHPVPNQISSDFVHLAIGDRRYRRPGLWIYM